MKIEKNLVLKSARRFLLGSFRAFNPFGKTYARVYAPRPPLTIRLGIAGHLYIEELPALRQLLQSVFTAVQNIATAFDKHYTELLPPAFSCPILLPECRVVVSLASGADQFAADIAHRAKFAIDAILPFPADRFRKDIYDNCLKHPSVPPGNATEFARLSLERFNRLLPLARARLEFDESHGNAYANAAALVLAHCDILIAIVHSTASDTGPGSTVWSIERARAEGVPVLRIFADACGPAANPFLPVLLRGNAAEELDPASIESALHAALRPMILGPMRNKRLRGAGRFERAYSATLDPERNEDLWKAHWPDTLTHAPGGVIGLSPMLRKAVVWADHRAAVYSQLSRGAVVIVAALAALAVAGGIAGVLVPTATEFGKFCEIGFVGAALYLIWHSHNRRMWRDRWLGYRQIERRLLHTALLSIAGGSPNSIHLSTLLAQPIVSQWPEWYVNAVRRHAGVPSLSLNAAWIHGLRAAIRDRLIGGQIRYFHSEIRQQSATDEWLECWSKSMLTVAVGVTSLYLLAYYLAPHHRESEPMQIAHRISTVIGAFGPAAASALSAVRWYGEYRQQAARYTTARSLLLRIRADLYCKTLDMSAIRAAAAAAVTVLGDELYEWRHIRSNKHADL